MAKVPISETVSLSRSPTPETPRHSLPARDGTETKAETPDLKELARLVFARNIRRDGARDGAPTEYLAVSKQHRQAVSGVSAGPHHKENRAEVTDPWDAEDYRTHFEERGAIHEHDGGLSRTKAEAEAYKAKINRWLNSHPVASYPADGCAWCHKREAPEAPLAAYRIGPHAWLHPTCWPAWSAARRAEAGTALVAMGIPMPPEIAAEFMKACDDERR